MRALEQDQYDKVMFRDRQRALSYPKKVQQVVSMQARIVPVMAARGRTIKPWTLDSSIGGEYE